MVTFSYLLELLFDRLSYVSVLFTLSILVSDLKRFNGSLVVIPISAKFLAKFTCLRPLKMQQAPESVNDVLIERSRCVSDLFTRSMVVSDLAVLNW